MSERAQPLFLGCDTVGLLKLAVTIAHPTSFLMIRHLLLTSFPMSGKEKGISEVLLPHPPRAMAEQHWTPSTIMPGHLQKLMKQGFMMVAKLATCYVPNDPAFPMPIEGYMVSFVAFYERGFVTLSHRFLCSMLSYYDLEFTT
jgi:hypothetical protein